MNKLIIASMLVFTFISCTNKPKEQTEKSDIFIEQKVSDFVNAHPSWTSGENTDEEVTDKFQHEVKRWSNEENFLDKMPLQLTELRDTTLNGQVFKIGTFTGYNDNMRAKGSILNYIQLRIDGFLPPEIEKTIQKDSKYTITGMLYKQGSRKDVKVIHVADFKGYDLGKYLFSITSVHPIK